MGDQNAFLNIILTVLSITFIVLAGFAIPFLLQIWRTAENMALTLKLLNERLPTIMKNLEEVTISLNRTTSTVNRQVEDLALAFRKVQGGVNLLIGVEEVLRSRIRLPLVGKIRTAAALIRGVRAFVGTLLDGRPGGRGAGPSQSR